jgi:hypothetical protein
MEKERTEIGGEHYEQKQALIKELEEIQAAQIRVLKKLYDLDQSPGAERVVQETDSGHKCGAGSSKRVDRLEENVRLECNDTQSQPLKTISIHVRYL